MKTKDITFVIVTFYSENVIFECLDSLPNDSKKIIVENSNNLNFKNILEEKYNNLRCILTNENLGYGKANNIGIKLSETDYIFILNPDVRFKHYNLKNFLEILNKENFVIAAPKALEEFKQLDSKGVIQLRILPAVGAEKFAEYFYHKINDWVKEDTYDRCRVVSVEVREHEKNSAIYEM